MENKTKLTIYSLLIGVAFSLFSNFLKISILPPILVEIYGMYFNANSFSLFNVAVGESMVLWVPAFFNILLIATLFFSYRILGKDEPKNNINISYFVILGLILTNLSVLLFVIKPLHPFSAILGLPILSVIGLLPIIIALLFPRVYNRYFLNFKSVQTNDETIL